MMDGVEQFSPGELIHARGREWVVVDATNTLTIRPLSGSESDIETIIPELEVEGVKKRALSHQRSTIQKVDEMPPNFYEMPCVYLCGGALVLFVQQVGLILNQEPINLPHS